MESLTKCGKVLALTNNIEPQAYIADVIAKIANDWPASRWDELMPWNWRPFTNAPNAQAA
jgi:transposase